MLTYRTMRNLRGIELQAKKGNATIMKLNHHVKESDIVCLVDTSGTLDLYSYSGTPPQRAVEYANYADLASKTIRSTIDGKLLVMGQLWINNTQESAAIANVTIGLFDGMRFHVSNSGMAKLGVLGQDPERIERTLTAIFRNRSRK